MDWQTLLPDALGWGWTLTLILASFITSFITAAIGIGGGVLLLAIMAQVIPTKAIIPVHGVIQLGSNSGRAFVFRQCIQAPAVLYFFIGSVIGAIIGGQLVMELPTQMLQTLLGLFILYSIWGPTVRYASSGSKVMSLHGGLSTLLTMFVGATGPFVLAALKPLGLIKEQLVATSAACMLIQHLLKVAVFGLLGFNFSDYVFLIAAMIFSGFAGTLLGKRVLTSMDEVLFKRGLNIILTILGVRLLWVGWS